MIACPSSKHFIKDYPKSPDIAFLRIMVLLVCLRGHILGGANIIIQLRFVWHLLHFTVTEVDDGNFFTFLGIALKEDVIWLEVSVYDLLISHVCISFEDLSKNE